MKYQTPSNGETEQRSKCRGCGAEVVWVKTKKGKSMPLSRTTREKVVLADFTEIYVMDPHWVDCPHVPWFKNKST